jgi:hypothetical protein
MSAPGPCSIGRKREALEHHFNRGWTWEEESAVPFAGGDCEIRIKGRLSDSLLAAFEGLMTTVQPVATVLHGPVQDQAALYRLLDRIQSLG